MIMLMMTGVLFISSSNNATAVGSLEATMEAGNTYFYNVDSFPSFQELID